MTLINQAYTVYDVNHSANFCFPYLFGGETLKNFALTLIIGFTMVRLFWYFFIAGPPCLVAIA